MKTISIKHGDVEQKWYLVDAQNKTLGRLATRIAHILRGKHKPEFTPNADIGDYVVVINADKIKVTGAKETDKIYYHHSGYTGGIKSVTFDKLLAKFPRRVIEHAVKGMLNKGPLGRKVLQKLKVYAGTEHPHQAQKLEKLEIEE